MMELHKEDTKHSQLKCPTQQQFLTCAEGALKDRMDSCGREQAYSIIIIIIMSPCMLDMFIDKDGEEGTRMVLREKGRFALLG